MAGLDPRGILSAVELAFFCPSLIISATLCFRHGFNTKYGWFYLLTLSILRIVGAAVTLYSETQHDYSLGLIITAAITSSIGTAPLLLALMGFLERIHTGMAEGKGVKMIVFRPLHLISLAALVIAIVGGTDESNSSVSDQKTGKALMETAAIIFLVMYLSLAAIALLGVTRLRYVLTEEHRLLRATVIALPFLLVRILYTQLTTFSKPGSIFYYRSVNVYVLAFMQFAMEAIVVTIFIIAGAMTPKWIKPQTVDQIADANHKHADIESRGSDVPLEHRNARQGRVPYHAPRQQQQRNIGDYRPSRLIMNAIKTRR